MKIYQHEKDLNLQDCIIASTSVDAALSIPEKFTKADSPAILLPPTKDLMAVQGILVTTAWNQNDDVFSPREVWPARYSAKYKPANMDHKGKEMDGENRNIGVICDSEPVDDDYNIITANIDGSHNIPEYYHLMVSMYLWEKYWPTPVKKIRDGIDADAMFISMECMFDDFGYAIRPKNGDSSQSVSLIPRNEETSWLTAYLKMYKGKGEINLNGVVYRIGRWLRQITFTGVGFTPKPANAPSILFDNYISHAALKEIDPQDFSKEFVSFLETGVFTINTGTISLWQ